MATTTQMLLNKIFRAVHDGVCPKCGGLMRRGPDAFHCEGDHDRRPAVPSCGFTVTKSEMGELADTTKDWGAELIDYFEAWRILDPKQRRALVSAREFR